MKNKTQSSSHYKRDAIQFTHFIWRFKRNRPPHNHNWKYLHDERVIRNVDDKKLHSQSIQKQYVNYRDFYFDGESLSVIRNVDDKNLHSQSN